MIRKILIFTCGLAVVLIMLSAAMLGVAVLRGMTSSEQVQQGAKEINLDHFDEAFAILSPIAPQSDPAKSLLALLLAAGKGTEQNPIKAAEWLDRDLQSSILIKFSCPKMIFTSTLPAKKYFLAESLDRLKSPQATMWFAEAKQEGFEIDRCWLKPN